MRTNESKVKAKESLQSRMVKLGIRMVRHNNMWKKTGTALRTMIEHKQRKESIEPPNKIIKKYNLLKQEITGHPYYVISNKEKAGHKHVLYLHGGGYVLNVTSLHWGFIAELVDSSDCTVTFPIYPLAPTYTHIDVFEMLLPLYQQLLTTVSNEDIIVMGDSAGGGMSVALAQLLKEKELPQPGNIILISPALDMTFSNPEIKEVEKKDPILATPSIKEIAEWYAGDQQVEHFLISPINGELEGLGIISIFVGTHDIVYPDTRKFKDKLKEQNLPFNYYEYPKMLHVWPLFFFPESKAARNQIMDIINDCSS
ncbi:alpha/beta hydrolase [Paenibacillus sp. FSL R10-2734]|uniref:alpha/beta hydrolase n=1 Tax=Paenibacillus sp. FSL R10-2734 TaxID=2954691 RepID=UPI0030DAEAF1